jgi:CHAT domain-containing protein
MVFDQLKSALNGCRRLFLAPDSNLTRLPFEVLPFEEERYLIDASYQFSYLGVGRDVLRFGLVNPGHSTSPIVAADPDYDLGGDQVSGFSAGKPFRRLGGTFQEGKDVAALLSIEPVLDQQALESKLKACRSPSILHVATHGFFLPDPSYNLDREVLADSRWAQLAQMQNPLLKSGLALAGANAWLQQGRLPAEAEDGLLTAEDVTGMDLLSTELAVLSACETGLGEVQDGEGVFGLRRAFLLAGAKTLVMSLWKVPDQETQELMVDFYQRILKGQPRGEALREAQLAMKTRHSDPFYWGAFVCQGDPGSLPSTYRYERNGRETC